MTKTEYGTLTVDEQKGGLELSWAGNVVTLFVDDEESLLQIGGKDGELDKGEREYLEDLATRIAGAFS
jgi:hypothetical protein